MSAAAILAAAQQRAGGGGVFAPSYVQQWSNNATTAVTSLDVTVSGETASNALFAVVGVAAGGDAFTTPSGWTLISDFSSGAFGGALYYRSATGSGETVGFSWTDSGRPTAAIIEVSGLALTLEDNAEDETNISTIVTSQGTGTATPTSTDCLGVAFGVFEHYEDWDGGFAVTDSYVVRANVDNATTSSPKVVIATKVVDDGSSQGPTFSTTDSGQRAYGAVGVWI